jgi:hypothetical protein
LFWTCSSLKDLETGLAASVVLGLSSVIGVVTFACGGDHFEWLFLQKAEWNSGVADGCSPQLSWSLRLDIVNGCQGPSGKAWSD